jgi:hypothetical protein
LGYCNLTDQRLVKMEMVVLEYCSIVVFWFWISRMLFSESQSIVKKGDRSRIAFRQCHNWISSRNRNSKQKFDNLWLTIWNNRNSLGRIAYDWKVPFETSICPCVTLRKTRQCNHQPHHSRSEEPGLENQTEDYIHGHDESTV